MLDARISDLPAATAPVDTDLAPIVQAGTGGTETRRVTVAQLRSGVTGERLVHVRDFGAAGDGTTDDTAAFNAAFAAAGLANGCRVELTRGRTYVVGELVLGAGCILDGHGATLRARAGAAFLVKLTGSRPQLLNVELEDVANNLVRQTTLGSGAASGATSIGVLSPLNIAARMTVAVELDSGDWHLALATAAPSGSSLALDRALPGSAAAGRRVRALHGALWLAGADSFAVDRVLFTGCWGAVVCKPEAAGGAGPRRGAVHHLRTLDARVFGIAAYSGTGEVSWGDLSLVCGTALSSTATGDGHMASFPLPAVPFLRAEIAVSVAGVAQDQSRWSLSGNSVVFNSGAVPAAGAGVVVSAAVRGARGLYLDGVAPSLGLAGQRMSDVAVSGALVGAHLRGNSAAVVLRDLSVQAAALDGLRIEDGLSDARFAGCVLANAGAATVRASGGCSRVVLEGLYTARAAAADRVDGLSGSNVVVASGTTVAIDPATWRGSEFGVSGGGSVATALRTGDTLTGPTTLAADPTGALHAATKQYVDTLASFTGAGVGAVLRTLASKLGERVSLADYVQPGDNGDDARAIQRAHDFLAGAGGGEIILPPRQVLLKSGVTVTAPVALIGQGHADSNSRSFGTCLVINDSSFTPFSVGGVNCRGFAVRNLSVAQSHPAPASGWAPTAHPFVFDILSVGGQITFENVLALEVDKFVSCVNSGRLTMRSVRGQVFTCGVYVDVCLDCPHIADVHFWPYWSENGTVDPNHYVLGWTQSNGDAFYFKRVDNPFLTDLFAFGYRAGLRVGGTTDVVGGSVTSAQIGSFCFDACRNGIWVDSTAFGAFLQIGNLYPAGEALPTGVLPDSSNIRIDGAATLQINNAKLFYTGGPMVILTNTSAASTLSFGNLIMLQGQLSDTSGTAAYIVAAQSASPHVLDFASFPQMDVYQARLLNFDSTNAIIPRDLGWNYQVIPAASGQTPTWRNAQPHIYLDFSGTLASYGLFGPANAVQGQVISVTSAGSITQMSWGSSVNLPTNPTSLSPGQTVRFKNFGPGGWKLVGLG